MTKIVKCTEMMIPRASGEVIADSVVSLIAVLGTVVAIFNLFFQVAVVVPCFWLALMALIFWSACQEEGGYRKFLVNVLGGFTRKHFAEIVLSTEIRFGFQLVGCRLYYLTVPIAKIQEVEWRPGQNPNLWVVFVWYDHDDPGKSLKKQGLRKPDQDVYCIGSSMPKKKTEVLGLAFLDFLLRSGARLVQQDDCTFVRSTEDRNVEMN